MAFVNQSTPAPTRSCARAVVRALIASGALALGAAAPAFAQSPPAPSIQTGPLTLTFGGFTELATIYRNRNQSADVGSDFNTGIPFANNPNSHISEFRESARQSRFSLLAQSQPLDGLRAEAYMETDFLSAGVTSNSRESNSYTLRMRVFYARMMTDGGLDVLAGQNWSLATLYKDNLNPRDEDAPLGIDAQYIVGFNWTRTPQLRVVEHFNKKISVGFSIESPQTVTGTGINSAGAPAGTYPPSDVVYQNNGNGAGLMNTTTTYTTDVAPDIIVKVAADPGWGHYEVYGLSRWFRSSIAGQSSTVSGGGIGAGMILPLIAGRLAFQASGLVGKGIGRYGSAQLPDVTMKPTGGLAPIREYEALLGLIYTPSPFLTVYGYAGRESENATYYTVGTAAYGYGAPEFNNSGCMLASGGTCVGNTRSVSEASGGFWWKYYQGKLGNLQFGLQGEYFKRTAFAGVGGAPSANMFVGMASFRYYPYQL
ncbi:MAG: hypothetical protein ACYCT1_18030 [Steroidobacteraceae bacterium]